MLYKSEKCGIIKHAPQSCTQRLKNAKKNACILFADFREAKFAPVAQLDSAFDSDNCDTAWGQARKRTNRGGDRVGTILQASGMTTI